MSATDVVKEDYILTTRRLPTRRAVMWLGQTCNIRCYFCYFIDRINDREHPQHPFMSLEKAKEICRIFRDEYDLNSIDIQGGEPTVYGEIFELIRYCAQIGLKPTLITNAVALNHRDYCAKFRDAGIYDFLISMQAIGDNYDRIVQVKGAFQRQLAGLENIHALGIPMRFNTVLSNEALPDLRQICDLAIRYRARVVNLLSYNAHGDQPRLREKERVSYYARVGELIAPLIEELESHGIEVNVRFFPFCFMKKSLRKNISNQAQKIYDLHEWEVSSRLWIDARAQREAARPLDPLPDGRRQLLLLQARNSPAATLGAMLARPFTGALRFKAPHEYQRRIEARLGGYEPQSARLRAAAPEYSRAEMFYFELNERYNEKVFGRACERCDLRHVCDGVEADYLHYHGEDGLSPVTDFGAPVVDPNVYARDQLKVVEKEELEWVAPELCAERS